jgi:hypothetical protein
VSPSSLRRRFVVAMNGVLRVRIELVVFGEEPILELHQFRAHDVQLCTLRLDLDLRDRMR